MIPQWLHSGCVMAFYGISQWKWRFMVGLWLVYGWLMVEMAVYGGNGVFWLCNGVLWLFDVLKQSMMEIGRD